MDTQIFQNFVHEDAVKQIIVDVTTKSSGFTAKIRGILLMLFRLIRKVFGKVLSLKTWKKKRTWIGALVGLRAAYVLMNEYALNPFKKSLKGEHVFLSGAGSGLGQLMAIKLGQLGCKLSLSDINMEGLKKTHALCVQAGV